MKRKKTRERKKEKCGEKNMGGKKKKISDETINRNGKQKEKKKKRKKKGTKMATKTRTTNHGLRRICKVQKELLELK